MKELKTILKKSFLSLSAILVCASAFSQDKAYEKALDQLNELNYHKAHDILIKNIEKHPSHSPSLYQLGKIELEYDDKAKAKTYFSKVVSSNTNFVSEAHLELSRLELELNDTISALEHLDKSILIEASEDALYERALLKFKTHNYEGSISDISKALATNNEEAKYFILRGRAHIEEEKYNDAITDLDTAIILDSKIEDAYFFRAYCLYTLAHIPETNHKRDLLHRALEDYNMCVILDPKDELAFFDRGETHMALAELKPSNKHHYIEAISDFKAALALNPNNKEAMYNKATCNYRYGYVEKALEQFKLALEIDPNFSDALYQVGLLEYDNTEFKESLIHFNQLIEQEEEPHSDAYLYRGYVHLELGNTEEACEDWQYADSLDDVDPELHRELVHDMKKYCKKYIELEK